MTALNGVSELKISTILKVNSNTNGHVSSVMSHRFFSGAQCLLVKQGLCGQWWVKKSEQCLVSADRSLVNKNESNEIN